MSSSETNTTTHRWHLNYADTSTHVSSAPQPQRSATVRAAVDKHTVPPGFPAKASAIDPLALEPPAPRASSKGNAAKNAALKKTLAAAYQSSWSIAFSPLRSILTSSFAMFMTGNTIHFFSVATTITVLFMNLRTLFSVRDVFRPPHKAGVPVLSLLPQVFVYLVLGIGGIGLGLYKANNLGFLPTTESDWISLLPPPSIQERYYYDSVVIPK